MKKLSASRLACTVRELRQSKDMSQETLGNLTGINRIMIGRIEKEDYIPSINQLEALGKVLEFELTDMFVERSDNSSFVALRSETITESEREGVDKLFEMMISLRRHVIIRRKLEDESEDQA